MWYNGEPIILAREILILNLFSWNIQIIELDIHIKKQIDLSLLMLLVLKLFLSVLIEIFLKILVSELKKSVLQLSCMSWKKLLKMRSSVLRPWLLYSFFVLGKYSPLVEPQFLFLWKLLIIAYKALWKIICGSQTVVLGPAASTVYLRTRWFAAPQTSRWFWCILKSENN